MSHDYDVVRSTTSVEELAELIQRDRYDSYPVVENGKMIGLLRSCPIERSISSHMLHEIAANLMETGKVTVYPDDSLPIALTRMADCNCRQIPVVDDGTGTVLGAISSIDLLKAMYPFSTIS